ncbi:MAG: phosphoribosylpyrophosphate synthetase [Acidobacteria bacterium CG_4_9_14_3_um_filter_49_7]|nr:MAG: phosphoribosylpyrophosphate synthetase [Acidobacteria bacterium CG_4_9_14_3_um_filter_49_7]
MTKKQPLKVFSGNANPEIAKEIANYLGIELSHIDLGRFSDGEISCYIPDNVRGSDVFFIQSTCAPANENLMELLIAIDTLKRSSANRITAVIPYFGYARQDRKHKPRVPITSKLVADLLERAGVSRILTMDLHANQIQGFFDVPVDHLYSSAIFIGFIRSLNIPDLCVVAPDVGGAERARAYSKRLETPLAIVDKRREQTNESEVMNVVGDVDGKNILIIDDIIDTAGTLVKTAHALVEKGARSIRTAITHGVLSGPAMDRINKSHIEKVYITNTIPFDKKNDPEDRVQILSVANLFGEAIKRTHEETSISSLFI